MPLLRSTGAGCPKREGLKASEDGQVPLMESVEPIGEFRMDPALRRSAWYVIAATPAFAAAFVFIGTQAPNRDPVAGTLLIAVFTLIPLSMSVPLSWRLRIDDEGISRRILWFWSCWTWSDFASGRMQKRRGLEFYDPARRRSLKIGYLPREVLPSVVDRINRSYVEAPAAPVLQGLQFGKRFPFQPRGRMDAEGIEIESKDGPTRIDWQDVIRLRFVRFDPLSRHYRTATLELPGLTITWVRAMSPFTQSSDGSVCTEEQINDFLLSFVPPEKVIVDRHGMRPHCRTDIVEQLQQMDRSHAELGKCLTICGVVVLAMLGCITYEQGLVKGLLSGVSAIAASLVFLVPVFWFVEREQHRVRRQLCEWLKEYDD